MSKQIFESIETANAALPRCPKPLADSDGNHFFLVCLQNLRGAHGAQRGCGGRADMTFIIINETQRAPTVVVMKSNSCWKNVPVGGILRIGAPGEASGFSSRAAAQGFIKRTLSYDRSKNPGLSQNSYEIYRVRQFLHIKSGL